MINANDNAAIEKESNEEAHKFLHWMEAAHGFIPYGFHGDIKRLLLAFANRIAPIIKQPTTHGEE